MEKTGGFTVAQKQIAVLDRHKILSILELNLCITDFNCINVLVVSSAVGLSITCCFLGVNGILILLCTLIAFLIS